MAQLVISGNFVSSSGTTISINTTINVPTPICAVTQIALASGFNSITIPPGTTFYQIQFPAGNATAVTLKGVTGDTGILLNLTGTDLLQVTPAQTTIGLTAAGAITALTSITFI